MRDRLESERCSHVLKALADPDRLKIVECLQGGPKDVSQITELLQGKLANISHHLKVLRQADIVHGEREGRHIQYHLSPAIFRSDKNGDVLDLNCCQIQLGR